MSFTCHLKIETLFSFYFYKEKVNKKTIKAPKGSIHNKKRLAKLYNKSLKLNLVV